MEINRDNLLGLIRSGIQRDSLSVSGLERKAGVPKDTLRDFLRGKTQILRADKLQKVLHILEPGNKVRITGRVGPAGAEIVPLDTASTEEADCPPGCAPSDVVAVRIEGESMLPVYHDGWIIYYTRRSDADIPLIAGGFQVPYGTRGKKNERLAEYLGKPCIVGLKNGRALLGTLKKAAEGKGYDLINYNASDRKNITPAWVAKIIFIKTE